MKPLREKMRKREKRTGTKTYKVEKEKIIRESQ